MTQQEDTINQLVLSLSNLKQMEASNKSVILDLEHKLTESRGEVSQLTSKLLTCMEEETRLQKTILSLDAQVGVLRCTLSSCE